MASGPWVWDTRLTQNADLGCQMEGEGEGCVRQWASRAGSTLLFPSLPSPSPSSSSSSSLLLLTLLSSFSSFSLLLLLFLLLSPNHSHSPLSPCEFLLLVIGVPKASFSLRKKLLSTDCSRALSWCFPWGMAAPACPHSFFSQALWSHLSGPESCFCRIFKALSIRRLFWLL